MHPYERPDIRDQRIAYTEMPVSDKDTIALEVAAHKRSTARNIQRTLGGVFIIVMTILTILLWLLLRPTSALIVGYLGEMVGTIAILLFSCALVLASRAPFLESFFGGLDRMYIWHRGLAIAGVALLLPHYLLIKAMQDPIQNQIGKLLGFVAAFGLVVLLLWALIPRLPVIGHYISNNYQYWFTLHRLTGLFVIAGLIHGFLNDPILHSSTIILSWYIIVAIIGTLAYLSRELINPILRRLVRHNYSIEAINRLNQKTFEVILTPQDHPLSFVAGQFIFVRFGGEARWERHPFTISSAPQESNLRISIKVLGDHTRRLMDILQPGTPASVGLPFGMFNYRTGGHDQIWIAGGIGITPFRSWIRAFPTQQPLPFSIDFYYTVHDENDALFLDEIRMAATRYPGFLAHLTYSKRDGSLTIEQIRQSCNGRISEKEIYMCGASQMTGSFQKELRKLGVPAKQIHFEHFSFR